MIAERSENRLPLGKIAFVFMLIIAAMLILKVSATFPNTHAVARHGVAAWSAAECFGGNGMVRLARINPLNHRRMSICQSDDRWFVKIENEDGTLVTMYQKEELHSLSDFVRYVWNSGFTSNP